MGKGEGTGTAESVTSQKSYCGEGVVKKGR